MKKYQYFLMSAVLIVLSACLTGCEDEKKDTVADPSDLLGVWTLLGTEDYINGFLETCAGSKFDFKANGSLYVYFSTTNSEIYEVTLVSKSGVHQYRYDKEKSMLYIETAIGTIAYPYKIINGRLYIYRTDKEGNEIINWQFIR